MDKEKPIFAVQWHVTSKCDQRCLHCYIFNSSEPKKSGADLELASLVKILLDYFSCCLNLGALPRLVLSGGDPLLRQDFIAFLDIIAREGKKVGFNDIPIDIMGNPFHLNKESAKILKEKGVRRYQISVDGMREKHDQIRRPGSFDDSMRALDVLIESGIETHVMLTVSKFNAADVIPLIELLAEKGVDAFAFARFSRPELMPIDEYKQVSFAPDEYRSFLVEVDKTYEKLRAEGYKTRFPYKDHLWKLLKHEEGKLEPLSDPEDGIVYSGCGLGMASVSILSDGTVYACRRFPSKIGKVPDQKLEDIFLGSRKLNSFRDLSKYVKCAKCELLQYCRGCGSVAYGMSGSFFDPDPQCWKKID